MSDYTSSNVWLTKTPQMMYPLKVRLCKIFYGKWSHKKSSPEFRLLRVNNNVPEENDMRLLE